MGHIVIVALRPKPGKDEELRELVRGHVPKLRGLGLATDHPVSVMRNSQGVFIEVFEWAEGAIERAHENPAVQKMWGRFEEVCEYVPLKELPETSDLFAQFEPVEL